MNIRTKEYVESIIANDTEVLKPWQRKERDRARANLLAGMPMSPLCKEFILAGAKVCRYESLTEFECVVQPDDTTTKQRIQKILERENAEILKATEE